jgi:TonB family protein
MPQAPRKRARGHLGRGTLLSLLLHAQLILPLGIAAFVYGGREEARRAEEIDVGFESVPEEELPKDLPPLEPPRDESALEKLKPDARKPPKDKKDKKEKDKKEKLAELEKPKPKPEPEIVTPPLPPMPKEQPPPPPPPERKSHEKMVDVENDKDVPPPPDAKFLAEKNNRVEQETRATETNLEKNQKGQGVESSPSDRDDKQVGSDKAKIAELQDQKSEAGRKAPSVTPHTNPELASKDDRREKSLLALRDPAPRTHEITPETADPSLPKAPDGDLHAPKPTTRGDESRADKANGKRVKLAITGRDYEYLFGADAEADRRLASKAKSSKLGKFMQRQQRAFSALENFIPEVKPGNQTALNTRAAPFAAFVARMHRSIHKLWGFGALEEWDEMSGTSPLNNPNLLTTLEMVLNADGTVDKITVVRTSGYTAYDLAAIDVAYQAGPYPDPPRAIRSANGKVYVHWRFYRDERQCATSGVDYFILDNPPSDADKASLARAEAAAEAGAPAPQEGPRRLHRSLDDAAHNAKMRALDAEVARAEGRAESEEPAAPAPAHAHPQAASPQVQDPAARTAAERFFGALAGGDAASLVALADVPFRVPGGTAVRARGDLAPMLKDLAGEVGRQGVGDVQIYSAAGLRSALGKLPPGLDDGSGNLAFGLCTLSDGGTLIVALAKRGGSYHAVALVRR